MTALLIAVYLGGVANSLLSFALLRRANAPVPFRLGLVMALGWPILLPILLVFPRVNPCRFRA